jgi:uncharacterized lipoprotein YddW (UPF0748 family)
LDVEIPEVATLFKDILVEFVKKYPRVDAVQWDVPKTPKPRLLFAEILF